MAYRPSPTDFFLWAKSYAALGKAAIAQYTTDEEKGKFKVTREKLLNYFEHGQWQMLRELENSQERKDLGNCPGCYRNLSYDEIKAAFTFLYDATPAAVAVRGKNSSLLLAARKQLSVEFEIWQKKEVNTFLRKPQSSVESDISSRYYRAETPSNTGNYASRCCAWFSHWGKATSVTEETNLI